MQRQERDGVRRRLARLFNMRIPEQVDLILRRLKRVTWLKRKKQKNRACFQAVRSRKIRNSWTCFPLMKRITLTYLLMATNGGQYGMSFQ